jgi:uncharacterized protein YdbL (DUF1318 family)
MKRFGIVLCLAAASLLALPCAAHAQPSKEQLKSQFKAREARLRELEQQAKVGETLEGYIALVEADATPDGRISGLVEEENHDRRQLYQVLADEINKENPNSKVKATVETIASRNALRNIERAGPEERLLVAKDHWIRIKDFPRYQRLTALKAQGRVGETADGMVEVVKPEDRSDPAVASLVRDENAARTAEYKALADREHADPSVIAKRMAKRNVDNARVGEMLRDENGSWRKK